VVVFLVASCTNHFGLYPEDNLTLLHPRVPKMRIEDKPQISFCKILQYKKSRESTAKEASFEWSHHNYDFIHRLKS